MALRNPFVISGYVSPSYFCDREDETKTLVRYLSNGRNAAIISTRRMGKTGLIRHCFQQEEIKNHFSTFFIDIYSTGSLREFVLALGKEIFEELKPKERKFLDQFFSVITSLRAAFRLDNLTGEPSFEIGLGDIQEANITLEEIFSYLEQANKPCIVAIDEFQQIEHYAEGNIEAVLRTLIQKCKNTYFVFAGSQQHIMSKMFQSAARPFYQSVSMMQLNQIPFEKYKGFVMEHFEQNNRRIESEIIEKVYTKFDGHTWYLQIMFNELFSRIDAGEKCDVQMFDEALTNLLSAQEFTFQEILSRLPSKQKEILIAIAKEGKASGVTSGDFIRKYRLRTPSSVQSAIKYLIEKDLVTQELNTFQVYDRFFGIWLKQNF
jgi:AAA+ ATPase superfamily predicted ATPase